MCVREHPRVILHRSNYNGIWEKSPIVAKKGTGSDFSNEFELPGFAYQIFLPVSAEKYKDLMDLKKNVLKGPNPTLKAFLMFSWTFLVWDTVDIPSFCMF